MRKYINKYFRSGSQTITVGNDALKLPVGDICIGNFASGGNPNYVITEYPSLALWNSITYSVAARFIPWFFVPARRLFLGTTVLKSEYVPKFLYVRKFVDGRDLVSVWVWLTVNKPGFLSQRRVVPARLHSLPWEQQHFLELRALLNNRLSVIWNFCCD